MREQWSSSNAASWVVATLVLGLAAPVHASHPGPLATDDLARARAGSRSLDAPRRYVTARGALGLPVAMHTGSEPDRGVPAPDAPSSDAPSSDHRSPPPPPPEPEPRPEAEPSDADSTGGIRWGLERPVARWKLAGFGASAGVFVAAGATALGFTIWLNGERGFRRQLIDEAELSLMDDNPNNDVDPNMSAGVDLCEFSAEEPAGDGLVRNAEITRLCERASSLRRVQSITGIVSLVGLASTAVFTVLMFANRDSKSRTARAWRRHGLQVGLSRAMGSGAAVEVAGRF